MRHRQTEEERGGRFSHVARETKMKVYEGVNGDNAEAERKEQERQQLL